MRVKIVEIAFCETGLGNSYFEDYREPSCGQFNISLTMSVSTICREKQYFKNFPSTNYNQER